MQICYDYEHSELLLYQNMVIQESGESEQALKHLDKYSDQICDKVTVKETYGKCAILFHFFMLLLSAFKKYHTDPSRILNVS